MHSPFDWLGGLGRITSRARTRLVPSILAIVLCLGAVTDARAQTVIFDWNPNYPGIGNGLGSGSITINLVPTVADPANFSNVAGSITALTYTWGGNGTTISLADVTSPLPTSFSAGGGYLITGFLLSQVSQNLIFSLANSAGLPGLPGPGSNNISLPVPAEVNAGVWQLQPVPVPAAVWLLGSALAGLGFLRRRG